MQGPNVILRLRYYRASDAELDRIKEKNRLKINNRKYYSSNMKDGSDYLNYIEDGIKVGTGFDYLDYMNSHEHATGVFNKNGLMDENDKREVRKLLRVTKSCIWDMVISFSEMFGKDKVKTYQDAYEIVKNNLPLILKENGIDEDNVVWFAGLHKNTDNRHIHISFFELEPRCRRANKKGEFFHQGKFRHISLENFKVAVEEYMSDNKYFFESYRRNLVNGTDEFLLDLDNKDSTQKKIRLKLAELYHLMPKGKIGYNHKSMEGLRPLIKEIETLILSQNPHLEAQLKGLKKQLEEHDLHIKEICEVQKINPDRFMLTDKYLNDFHRRIGNKIIEYAKKYEVEDKFDGLNYERQKIVRNRIKRNSTLLFKQTATLNRMVNYEAERTFEDFRKRLKEAEYQRLVEEGVLEKE